MYELLTCDFKFKTNTCLLYLNNASFQQITSAFRPTNAGMKSLNKNVLSYYLTPQCLIPYSFLTIFLFFFFCKFKNNKASNALRCLDVSDLYMTFNFVLILRHQREHFNLKPKSSEYVQRIIYFTQNLKHTITIFNDAMSLSFSWKIIKSWDTTNFCSTVHLVLIMGINYKLHKTLHKRKFFYKLLFYKTNSCSISFSTFKKLSKSNKYSVDRLSFHYSFIVW